MSVRSTREERPILTGGGKTPPAIRRSSVRLEMESWAAARGRVNSSQFSGIAGGWAGEGSDVEGEEVTFMAIGHSG